jgi:hypothetical protein
MRLPVLASMIPIVAALLTACSDSSAPIVTTHVSMIDACDPASFNAGLGAGSCAGAGVVTLSAFNAELNATRTVQTWRFIPGDFTMHTGESIAAVNDGGEPHTFTKVAQFGGGIVPSLNQASGNPVEAPECAQLTGADFVAAGATFNTPVETVATTTHYQCCLHPWMRSTVTVVR